MMREALTAASAAAARLNPSSPSGQDIACELVDMLDMARALFEKLEQADKVHDSRVEGFLARNDAMRGAA